MLIVISTEPEEGVMSMATESRVEVAPAEMAGVVIVVVAVESIVLVAFRNGRWKSVRTISVEVAEVNGFFKTMLATSVSLGSAVAERTMISSLEIDLTAGVVVYE